MATGTSTGTTSERAQSGGRAWAAWLLLGLALAAVAVVALFWAPAGSRLVLGAVGLLAAGRGIALVRGEPGGQRAGQVAVAAGAAGVAVAVASAGAAGGVLLVGVPVVLLAAALGLIGRAGAARRGGQVLLVWTVLVTALLVAAGVSRDWHLAAGVATAVAALGLAGLGVAVLVGAAGRRATAPAVPAPPAGCTGCACGGGGCSALG